MCIRDSSTAGDAYTNYGVAWYYILDTENRRFKLPRTKYSTTGVRTNVGDYVEPGLPNITGNIYQSETYGDDPQADGVFTITKVGAGSTSSQGHTSQSTVNFDASRSSSIYGNSDTVQPPATQMYLYFYVGNFTPEATEVNAGINTETLNNKVDRSDLVDVAAVIESYRNGTSWYRIWSDGWCEQGGFLNGSIVTVSLLKPYVDTLSLIHI